MQNQSTKPYRRAVARYKTVIDIPEACLRTARCIMPSVEALMDLTNPARAGFVRHGGVNKAISHVPASYKPAYHVHAQRYLESLSPPDRDARRTVLMLGSRNSFQNLLLPLWMHGNLIHRSDEPWRTTIYTALCGLASGKLVIQKLRFQESNGSIVANGESSESVEWAVTGQPVLFHGDTPPISLLAAMTYDLRHIYHLLWESWQTEMFPEFRWHKDAHDELMQSFMKNLDKDVKTRASALNEIAARRALQLEQGYLHSSLGLRRDGAIVSLMMTGSLDDHGRVHQELGAESAVLLDNGGSVSAAYWSAKNWDPQAFEGLNPPQPVFFGGGSYFRNAALTALLFDLNEDILEEPFCSRPFGDEAWAEW